MATYANRVDQFRNQVQDGGYVFEEVLDHLYNILNEIKEISDTRSTRVIHETFTAPDAAATNNAMTQYDLATKDNNDCPIACVGEASPDFPRNVVVTGTQLTGATSVTVSVVGTDLAGDAASEEHTVTTAAKVSTGSVIFATVTAVTITAITGTGAAGDLLDVGYSTKIGLAAPIATATKVTEDGVETGVGDLTVDTTYSSVIFESAPNASIVYDLWYVPGDSL